MSDGEAAGSSCGTGKIRYATAAEAREAAAGLRSRRGAWQGKIEVYHCDLCGAYHLGNQAKSGTNRRWARRRLGWPRRDW